MATPTPPTPAPGKKINRIGLEPIAYRGSKTTLCAGCGHNAITERIIDSFWELGINPEQDFPGCTHWHGTFDDLQPSRRFADDGLQGRAITCGTGVPRSP